MNSLLIGIGAGLAKVVIDLTTFSAGFMVGFASGITMGDKLRNRPKSRYFKSVKT